MANRAAFLTPAKSPFYGPSWTPILVSYWLARWSCESLVVSFCPAASQWQMRFTLPFPSCSLCNHKLPTSRLLGLPPAFILLGLFLKMEAIFSSETTADINKLRGVISHYITRFPSKFCINSSPPLQDTEGNCEKQSRTARKGWSSFFKVRNKVNSS
jgi:hypothetical protein